MKHCLKLCRVPAALRGAIRIAANLVEDTFDIRMSLDVNCSDGTSTDSQIRRISKCENKKADLLRDPLFFCISGMGLLGLGLLLGRGDPVSLVGPLEAASGLESLVGTGLRVVVAAVADGAV